MRNFKHSLLADMELERHQLAKCKKDLRALPEGRLKTGNHGKNLYCQTGQGELKYISFHSKTAEKLSRRRFLEKRIRIIEENLREQAKLLQRYTPYTDESILTLLPNVYRDQMIRFLERKRAAVLSDDGLVGYGGRARHKTPKGEGRDSKGEVMLSMRFDGYGIPYAYGQPLFWKYGISAAADRAKELFDLPDFIIPDFIFTLPSGRILYWEHLGKLDDEKYIRDWMKKLQFYYWMGITQGVDLIVTSDDCNGTIDMEAISEIIETRLAPLITRPKHRA